MHHKNSLNLVSNIVIIASTSSVRDFVQTIVYRNKHYVQVIIL